MENGKSELHQTLEVLGILQRAIEHTGSEDERPKWLQKVTTIGLEIIACKEVLRAALELNQPEIVEQVNGHIHALNGYITAAWRQKE